MSNRLEDAISKLSMTFATNLLEAIKGASLEEILGATAGARGASPAVKRGPGRPPKAAAAPAVAKPAASAKAPKAGRGGRRSSAEIESTIARIVGALKGNKSGMRSEQLQKALGIDKKDIFGPLTKALADGKLTKKGEKRSTTYFAK
jgi:hypothetical protein